MRKSALLLLSVVALASLSLAATITAQETNDNIVDILAEDEDFDSFYDAVIAAGLADSLAAADHTFTVFVPREQDFNQLEAANPGALNFLMADPEGDLASVVHHHVVEGEWTRSEIAEVESLTTVDGEELAITVVDGVPFVDGAEIVTADIAAKNGLIHVIDSVLLPATLTLPAAVDEIEAVETETPVAAEAAAGTGGPLVPTDAESPTETEVTAGDDFGTIIEVLTENGNFTHFLNALAVTGLTESFEVPANYTIFAPTDAAFEAFNSDNLTENDLKSLLLFHVVADELTRDQLATDELVPTLSNARPIFVNRVGSKILNLSGAEVVTFNIPASNGIIHAVDAVMIPK